MILCSYVTFNFHLHRKKKKQGIKTGRGNPEPFGSKYESFPLCCCVCYYRNFFIYGKDTLLNGSRNVKLT